MQLPVTTERHQQSYLEFVQGLKLYSFKDGQPAIRSYYEQVLEPAYEAEHGRKPANYLEVRPLVEPLTAWRFDRRINRSSQEMMWHGILDIVDDHQEEMRAQLHDPATRKLGSVRLNPDIQMPKYYVEADFHLRPGGMWQGDLQGWYTTIANWVYFMGRNNATEDQTAAAHAVPDRPYKRILDMACGSGQSTEPLKRRFPNAEVHGVDLSGTLVDYAHVTANVQGLDIHYSQQNAEETDFPDGHFDLVMAFILFHEIPDKAARRVIAEAYRLLEPGGVFCIADVSPYRTMPAYNQFFTDWQTQNNGEAFWRTHGQRDLPAWFREAGFSEASFFKLEGKTLGINLGIK